MSTIETLEYYESCPGCGASNDGSGVCPYCGSSMIKSRKISKPARSIEDTFREEDRGLPVVKGKSGEINSFMKFFCPLFGGIFITVPTALFFAFAGAGLMEFWLIGFFSIFWLIGFGSLVPFIANIARNMKCKRGKRVMGTVRSYENSTITVNGSPALILRIRVDDTNPYIVQINTGESTREYSVGSRLVLRVNDDCYLIEGSTV